MPIHVLGQAGNDPEIRRAARAYRARYLRAAVTLVERIQIDGTDVQENITLEDIERLNALDIRAKFMRDMIVLMLQCLRIEVDPKAREHAYRMLTNTPAEK